ncbi:MAG: ATP-binding protein [Candidatus Methylacidiphilales bacterium]
MAQPAYISSVAPHQHVMEPEQSLSDGMRSVLFCADMLLSADSLDALVTEAITLAESELGAMSCRLFLREALSGQLRAFPNIPDGPLAFAEAARIASCLRQADENGSSWFYFTPQPQVGGPLQLGFPIRYRGATLGAFLTLAPLRPSVVANNGAHLLDVDALMSGALDERRADALRETLAVYTAFLGPLLSQKRDDVALAASEHKYRVIFENSPEPMYVFDADTFRFLAVNHAAVSHYGFSREEFLGMTLQDIRRPEDISDITTVVAAVRRHSRHVGDVSHRKRNGQIIDVTIAVHPIPFEGREAMLVIATDVTEKKRSQARMERLAAFPRFNPNPIIEFSATGSILYANEAAYSMLNTFGGNDLREILMPEVSELIRISLATGRASLRHELLIQGRTISWSFFPVPGLNTVHCYGGDITERMSLESQLRQAQKMESIGNLAGGLAHDFNNILTAVLGYSSILLGRKDLPPEVMAAARQISAAGQRASSLTRQLLTFSKKQTFSPRSTDLNPLVLEMEPMLATLLGETIRIRLDLSPEPLHIMGDPGMVEQIILNLSINARDSMASSGAGGTLKIRTFLLDTPPRNCALGFNADFAALTGPVACMEVTDNGCGMPPETQARIFDPFFTTKEPGKGTGLGLATVYGILRQHKGCCQVDSVPGMGTTFRVCLPLADAPPVAEPPPPEALVRMMSGEPPRADEKPRPAIRVLLVEDEAAVREFARDVLMVHGCEVIEANHGLHALHLWKTHGSQIDILLTDIVMPHGMSGRELAAQLRAERPNLSVIYTSGYAFDLMGPDKPEEAAAAGGSSQNSPAPRFLAKPYTVQSLTGVVLEAQAAIEHAAAS